jgi:hypothetical protein
MHYVFDGICIVVHDEYMAYEVEFTDEFEQ